MIWGRLAQRIKLAGGNAAPDTEVAGITCDSRKVQKNWVYVAVRGTNLDGNAYIPQARASGASVIVSELPGEDHILVEDAREAYSALCACFYGDPAKKLTMAAVTGTNGKSSVSWLLKQVIEAVTGEKCALLGTVENHLGGPVEPAARTTPQSEELHRLLAESVKNGCRYAVMEVSSHGLDQGRTAGLEFAAAAFTNLSRDHLDYHRNMESYCDAKAKLFGQSRAKVVNLDDPWSGRILRAVPDALTFSARQEADLRAEDISLRPRGVSFTAKYLAEAIGVGLGIPGLFSVYNALAVLGVALSLGLPLGGCAAALRQARGIRGRAEVVPTPGTDYTVIIDYAHTPDGMENILTALRSFCKGRLICLFGCGGDRDKGKRAAMGEISSRMADITLLTSDNPRFEPPMDIIRQVLQGVDPKKICKVLENRGLAIRYAMDIGKKDDIIVLLGKGHETTQEIMGEFYAFDEREILQKHLAEKR